MFIFVRLQQSTFFFLNNQVLFNFAQKSTDDVQMKFKIQILTIYVLYLAQYCGSSQHMTTASSGLASNCYAEQCT